MTNAPQVETLRALVAHLRGVGLPQSPTVRAAIIGTIRREEIADATLVTIVPGVPKSERIARGRVGVSDVFDVAIQRAVQTATDAKGAVQDLDWGCVTAMMGLQRAVMLALYAFPGMLTVEGVNAGAPEHAVQGVWTGVFRVTIQGATESLP